MTTGQTSLDRFVAARATRAPQSAIELRALADDLDDPRRWSIAAAALLAELGFRLVDAGGTGDDSHLLVALREEPTYRHFDPERVEYFAPNGRVAALTSLDRATAIRRRNRACQALWGHVHVVDRVPVENRFLTFGGDVRLVQVDPALTIVDLWSPAPIVRWGGNSQQTDALAEAIGAFFGRLIVPVDFVPGAAEKVDGLLPEVLYRAFLIDALARQGRSAGRAAAPSPFQAWLAAAWRRARGDERACAAARRLLVELGLGTPTS